MDGQRLTNIPMLEELGIHKRLSTVYLQAESLYPEKLMVSGKVERRKNRGRSSMRCRDKIFPDLLSPQLSTHRRIESSEGALFTKEIGSTAMRDRLRKKE